MEESKEMSDVWMMEEEKQRPWATTLELFPAVFLPLLSSPLASLL